jgi:aspartate/methionine/tyrosine aminotransferase
MKIPPFKLEEYFSKYEFTAPYLLCCSDAESWTLKEILDLADPETKTLWDQLSLGYTEPAGLPLLRKEIANLYSTIQPNQVVTFAGAEEGIYCSMRTLIYPGDHVINFGPCYQSLDTLPKEFGAEVTTLPLDPKKNWKFSVEEVAKAFRPNTKLLILNTPHNPTGSLLTADVLNSLIDLARKNGAYIFADEVYRYLEVDEKNRLPAIADAYEKGISLNVMSKAFGLAGLRIGWLATRDKAFLEATASYKLYTTICNSAPSEILALIALRARDVIIHRAREIILTNLQILDRLMERHPTRLSWTRPKGGTVAVIQLLLPIPVEKFAQDLVEKTGVLIIPGTYFDLPGNFFRIGFGRKNMPSILERFEQFLNQLS